MGRGTGSEETAGAPRRGSEPGPVSDELARRAQVAQELGLPIPKIEIDFDDQGNSVGPMRINVERALGFDLLRNTLASGERTVLFHGPAEARADRMIEQTAALREAPMVEIPVASAGSGVTVSQAGEQAALMIAPAQARALATALERDCVVKLDFGSELEPSADALRLLARGLREGELEIDGQRVEADSEAVLMGNLVRVGTTLPGVSTALLDEVVAIRQGQHDANDKWITLDAEPSSENVPDPSAEQVAPPLEPAAEAAALAALVNQALPGFREDAPELAEIELEPDALLPVAELRARSFEAAGDGVVACPIGRREAARLALNLLVQGYSGDEAAVDSVGLLLDARMPGGSGRERDSLGRNDLVADLYQPLREFARHGWALNRTFR